MKLKNYFLLAIIALVGLTACGGGGSETPKTNEQKLVRQWKVQTAKLITGSTTTDVTAQFSAFRISFTVGADNKGATYTVVTGSSPSKPSAVTNGTWTLDAAGTTITLDKGTANERQFTVKTVITETTVTILWKVPRTEDKTEPSYELVLIPA